MPAATFAACNPPDKTSRCLFFREAGAGPGTNRRPFHRRRSPRHGHREEGLGGLLKRRAKSSKSKLRRHARGAQVGTRVRVAFGRASRRRGTGRRVPAPQRRPPRQRRALALTKSPTGVTKGGSARASAAAALAADVARARRMEDEADRVGARVDGGGRCPLRCERPQILIRVRWFTAASPRAHVASGQPVDGWRSIGNRMDGIVVRTQEVAARRRRRSGRRARGHAARAPRRSQSGGRAPLPTATSAAHDVADHVVQERIGVEIEAPVGAAPLDRERAQRLHRRRAPGTRRSGTR